MVDRHQQNGFLGKVDRFADSFASLISSPSHHTQAKLAIYFFLIFIAVGIPVSLARHIQTSGFYIVSVKREQKAGNKFARYVEKRMPLLSSNDARVAYVDEIGHRIAEGNNPWNADFRFGVVDDQRVPNAFAVPGGRIYITTGMLDKLDNEAELAAVLAHEVAHVAKRHYARALGREMIKSWIMKFLGGTESTMLRAGTYETSEKTLIRMDQEDELEADYTAALYLYHLNYDVSACVTLAEKLLKLEEKLPDDIKAIPEAHPAMRVRMEAMINLKDQLSQGEDAVLGQERYRKVMKKSSKKRGRYLGLEFPIKQR